MDETTATPVKIARRHPARAGRRRLFGALIAVAMMLLVPAAWHTRPKLAPGAAAMSQPATEEAFFQFDYPPYPETFIFKLTDPAKIQEARDILSCQPPSWTRQWWWGQSRTISPSLVIVCRVQP